MISRRQLTWIALLIGEACLAALVVGAFWWQDWKFSLPTPRPANLRQAAIGEPMILPATIAASSQPTLLHFFNPDCPCSRFNLDHVRELIQKYRGQIRVVAVLETSDARDALQAFALLKINCEAVADPQGEIATAAGVYSTPQAVVLDAQGQLYYRGNYNRGRFCTATETEFVRLAIDGCLQQLPPQVFPGAATIATGCELPASEFTSKPARLAEGNRR